MTTANGKKHGNARAEIAPKSPLASWATRLGLSAALAGQLAFGPGGCADGSRATEGEPSKPVSAAMANDGSSRSEALVRWEVGRAYAYALSLESEAILDGQGSIVQFLLEGTVRLVPLRAADGAVDFAMLIESPRIKSEKDAVKPQAEALTEELAKRPTFFSVKDGLVTGSRFYPDTSAFAAGILRAISSALQVAEPQASARESWTAVEHDGTGRYAASYTRNADGTVAKKKLRYESQLASGQTASSLLELGSQVPEVASSLFEIKLESGVPSRIASTEEVSAFVTAEQRMRTTTTLTLALEKSEARSVDPALVQLQSTAPFLAASEPFAAPVSQAATDAARMKGWTFEKVVAELEKLAKNPSREKLVARENSKDVAAKDVAKGEAWTEAWSSAFEALPAFFRQNPETVDLAKKKIDAGSPATDSLVGALAAAGTARSQGALADVAENTALPNGIRTSTTLALCRAAHPSPETGARIEKLLQDPALRIHAVYGLGSYSRRLREAQNDAEADRLGKILVHVLESGVDADSKIHALRGIANSGYSGALEAVKPHLGSLNPAVRTAAVDAISRMPGDTPETLLAEKMAAKSETSADVRRIAVKVATLRPMSERLRGAVLEAARNDPEPQVRYEAVSTIARWSRDHAELSTVLAEMAQKDTEPKIRERAEWALANLDTKRLEVSPETLDSQTEPAQGSPR